MSRTSSIDALDNVLRTGLVALDTNVLLSLYRLQPLARDALVLSACQLLAASVMLSIALAFAGAPAPHVTIENVAAIVVLGIIGTGFAYVLNYQIITSEGAAVASTVTYLLPVVAIALGVLVLGESVTVTVLAGIALVLAGVALTRRRPKPVTDKPPAR